MEEKGPSIRSHASSTVAGLLLCIKVHLLLRSHWLKPKDRLVGETNMPRDSARYRTSRYRSWGPAAGKVRTRKQSSLISLHALYSYSAASRWQ